MGQQIQRGAIYYTRLSPVIGSEQGGFRPVVINLHSPTVIVAPITAQMQKHRLPTHVPIKQNVKEIKRDSQILLEQIRTIDKQRLADQIGQLNQATMKAVNQALQVSLSLN